MSTYLRLFCVFINKDYIFNKLNLMMEAKERGERLRYARTLANLKPATLEKDYGLSRHTLRAWEKGLNSGLTTQGAKRVVTILSDVGVQCTVGWLMTGKGEMPSQILAPQAIVTQENETLSSHYINIDTDNELELFYENCINQYCQPTSIEIIDDGLEPYYHKGEIVAGIRFIDDRIQSITSSMCIVELETGEILTRFLKSGNKLGLYHLVTCNLNSDEESIYDVKIASAAKIIRKYTK